MHTLVRLGIIPANCWRVFYMDADEYAHAQLPLSGKSHSFLAVISPKLTHSQDLGPAWEIVYMHWTSVPVLVAMLGCGCYVADPESSMPSSSYSLTCTHSHK